MGTWPIAKLGELIEFHDHRRVPLNSRERAERSGPYPYYGASGVIDSIDAYIFDGRYLLIAEDGENLRSRKTPIAFFADGRFWVNNHAHVVRGIKDRSDDRYLKAALEHADLSGYITGSAQPKLSQASLRLVELPCPPIGVQQQVAEVLTTYDELIKNGQRRIRTIEEMARAVYREWFVAFSFPGHRAAGMVDTPLGRLPAGWSIVPLRGISSKIGSGATPRGGSESYKTSGTSLIRSMNVYNYRFDDDGLAFIDGEQAALLDNVDVQPRDILLNITGASVARCCIAPAHVLPARVNQHVAIIRVDPSKADPQYVLETLNDPRQKGLLLKVAQAGATREALTKETISEFKIVLPPRDILDRYADLVGPILEQVSVLRRASATLRATRDLLLPRLMSGELDVSRVPAPASL